MARFFVALLAVAMLAMSPTAALANPNAEPTIQIRANAELVNPAMIEVVVVASCPPYTPTGGTGTATLFVSQAETSGSGVQGANFTCDGQNHEIALFVTGGPWALGEATVRGQVCGFFCADPLVFKVIHIN